MRAYKPPKLCPECAHPFQGFGWSGIDAHWRNRHEKIMCYEEAWPQIKAGTYTSEADKYYASRGYYDEDNEDVFDYLNHAKPTKGDQDGQA